MDFEDDVCIIGHSGAGDPSVSSRKPILFESGLFHGKSGKGFLAQFFPRHGSATLLSCTQDGSGGLRLVAAEGEIVPGPSLGLGDTNCRMRFGCGLRDFVERWSALGPSHHAALSLGRHIDALPYVSTMLDMPVDVAVR